MPDVRTLAKGEMTEYLNFLQWLASQFGVWRAITRHEWGPNLYKGSEEYKKWTQLNRPKAREAPSPILTEYAKQIAGAFPTPEARTAEVQRIQGLQAQKGEVPVWAKMGLTESDFLRLQAGLPIGEEKPSPYQEWYMQFQERGEAQRQAEAQREYEERVLGRRESEAERRYNIEQLRLQQLFMGPSQERDLERRRQQEKANIFEQIRGELLSRARESPRDWINVYRLSNAVNPYTQKPLNYAESLQHEQEELDRLQTAYTAAAGVVEMAKGSPWIQATEEDINRVRVLGEAVQNAERRIADLPSSPEGVAAAKWATPREVGPGQFAVGEPETTPAKPSMPEIPEWLGKPLGLKGRVPETRGEIPTPSGQWWTSLPWGQRQMFAGLVDWAGKEPYQDVLDRMAQMLPRTPDIARRWSPARQVA